MNTQNSQVLNTLAAYRLRSADGDREVIRAELAEARNNLVEFLRNLEAAGVFSFAELSPARRAEMEAIRLAVVVAELALALASR